MPEWTPSEILVDERKPANATPVYRDGRYVVQTTRGDEAYTLAGIDVDELQDAIQHAIDGFVSWLTGVRDALMPVAQSFVRWGIAAGLIESPHTSYRHTRYGRVPRLTPALRARQRELRRAGGRR